ncbi:MAG: DUF2333 family protein [Pseudomonadota bacterium]
MTATVPNAPELDGVSHPAPDTSEPSELKGKSGRGFNRRRGVTIAVSVAAALVVAAALNFVVGAPMIHEIDNGSDILAVETPENESRAIAAAVALIEREVNEHRWTPNDPWFAPSSLLDNMPNFQAGIMRAVGRFSFEMLDQVARRRGSSAADADLERATGFLQFPPDVWVMDLRRSFLPTVPSENQYREGLAALERYNERLAAGNAVFERRADTLAGPLSRIAADLGSLTAQLESGQQTGWWIFSTAADDVFYQNKGMLYGYYVLLSALGDDFESVIRERNLEAVFEQTLDSLREGAQLQPMVVLNGGIERSIFANHLALQGFYLKRVIIQLEEVVSVLEV